MAVTLKELNESKTQKLVQYLYLNSEWLMGTWSSVEEMAQHAHRITESDLERSAISSKLTDRSNKDGTKKWQELSVKILIDSIGTLVFSLPVSWENEDPSVIKSLLVGKIFAPKGESTTNAV